MSNETATNNLDPNSAWKKIQENKDNPNFVLLDFRTPGEYEESHIDGSVLINYQAPDFREEIQKLDKDKTYLVYCHSGMRAAAGINIMREEGFKKVHNISGGIMGWIHSDLPTK